MSAKPEFEGWAIVELMGHRRLAGHVRDVTMFGASFCRLDVPCDPPVTQYYGPSAIYCVTPTTEEIAKKVAKHSSPSPVHAYELQLPAPRATRDAEHDVDESEELDGDVDGDAMPDDDCHHDDVRF